MRKKIIISTGGTGGHVIPALNLYNHLKNSFDVSIYTDLRGSKYIPNNIKKTIFEVKKLPEKKYFFPLKLILLFFAFIKSLNLLFSKKIDIVISTGGYMSLPIVLAAKLFRKKIILFEPNSIIGRSNKLLLGFSDKIFCYDQTIIENNKKVIIDPVLNNCFYLKKNDINISNDTIKILIMGGSQASLFFTKNLKTEVINLSKKYKIDITQQLSSNFKIDNFKKDYDENGIKNTLFFFEDNFLCKSSQFDIAITRAGASSLAELSFLNIPFICIPFPHATDNHQYLNAKRYYDLNCCWILEEKNFNSGDIYKIIDEIMFNKKEYLQKKKNLSKLNSNNTWEKTNKKIIDCLNDN